MMRSRSRTLSRSIARAMTPAMGKGLLMLLMVFSASVFAGEPYSIFNPGVIAMNHPGGPPPRQQMLPGNPRAKVGSNEAASEVKKHYPGNKILSVQLVQGGGSPVYRVKMLSSDGVVKFAYVNGTNGQVFQ